MHTNFKSSVMQAMTHLRDKIIFLRHETKGRPKPHVLFQPDQLMTFVPAFGRFNIMGQNKSELLLSRPSRPLLRGPFCGFIYRPDVFASCELLINKASSRNYLEPPWNKRFYRIVNVIPQHVS